MEGNEGAGFVQSGEEKEPMPNFTGSYTKGGNRFFSGKHSKRQQLHDAAREIPNKYKETPHCEGG